MEKQDESKMNFEILISTNKIHQKSCNIFNKSEKILGTSIISTSSCESTTTSFDSNSSNTSFSSSDLMEDATSSSSSSSSNGPLYQLSDLMDKLPIKRGLSKYYKGKSESFTSLASVENLEDLVKRENPYKRKKMKSSCRNSYSPKPTLFKKASYSRNSFSRNCSNNLMSKPPPVHPVLKDF